jgi:hypothetical protein
LECRKRNQKRSQNVSVRKEEKNSRFNIKRNVTA